MQLAKGSPFQSGGSTLRSVYLAERCARGSARGGPLHGTCAAPSSAPALADADSSTERLSGVARRGSSPPKGLHLWPRWKKGGDGAA